MEKIIVESKETPEYSFIWLHGLGARCSDLQALAENIPISWKESIKHILPQAPQIPVTINNNMVMPAWYDIYTLSSALVDNVGNIDLQGIQNSVEHIDEIIKLEIKQGILPQNIYLIGFSQGGVICSYLGITTKLNLGGIAGLSTYLPFDADFFKKENFNRKNSFFIAHGTQDSVIPFEVAQRGLKLLKQNHIEVHFQSYEMDHGICQEEYIELATWIKLQDNCH